MVVTMCHALYFDVHCWSCGYVTLNSSDGHYRSLPDALWPLALPGKCLHLASAQADVLTTPAVVGKIIATG
jgi:hypothetical protein